MFLGKEAILAQDEATFLNSVSLLYEVFEHLRLADGTVINVLAVRATKIEETGEMKDLMPNFLREATSLERVAY